jgi:Tfp pilus assembly protein PilN
MPNAKNRSMITINLLPPDRRRMSVDWLPKAAAICIATLAIGAVLALNAYYAFGNMALRQNKATIESEIAEIQPEVDRVKRMESEIAVLHRKETVINDLVLNRIEWARKLNQLSDILPARVWLEEVALVKEKGVQARDAAPRKVLRIVGLTQAMDHARSLEAAFIYNIMHSPFMEDFESVQLVKSERTEWSGDKSFTVWKFELNLPLKNEKKKAAPAKRSSGTSRGGMRT